MKISDSKKGTSADLRGETLKQLMGANARRIRQAGAASLEDFAEAARHQGLPWSTGRVGDLEGGRVEAKLSNALAVAQTLANITGQPVALADLFAGSEFESLLRGEPILPQANNGHDPNATATDLARRNGWTDVADAALDFGVSKREVVPMLVAFDSIKVTDRRAAKALNISLEEFTRHAVQLWGHQLSAERDRLAQPEDSTAQLGQRTRQLRDEIARRIGQHL